MSYSLLFCGVMLKTASWRREGHDRIGLLTKFDGQQIATRAAWAV
jgi:hypothetical protein